MLPAGTQLFMFNKPEQQVSFALQRHVAFWPGIMSFVEHTLLAATRRLAASASEPSDVARLKANAAPNAIANTLRISHSPLGSVVVNTAIVAPATPASKTMAGVSVA